MRLEQSKDPDCDIFWSTYQDNKFCDEQYKQQLEKLINESEYYYGVYVQGKWMPLDISGQIYKKYIDKLSPEGNLQKFDYIPQLPLNIFCDFNVDPMKWAFGQTMQGNDFIFEELVQYDTYTERMALSVKERFGQRQYIVYGDYTGSYRSTKSAHTDYEIIKQVLGNVILKIKPNPPLVDRQNATHWRICNLEGIRRLFIDPKCEHTRKDFRQTRFKEGTREEEQTIIDNKKELSHLTCAIGYYCDYEYSLKGKPLTYTQAF